MRTTVYLLALAIFYGACEKVEKIEDFPLVPPKLVVNATITAGETMSFEVSKSLSVIDNAEIRIIDNAQILLYENNQLIETLDQTNFVDQKYVSVTQAKKNVIYKIEVSAPKFSKVTATTSLPTKAAYSQFELRFYDSSWHETSFGDLSLNIEKASCTFVIDDPADSKNYYAVIPKMKADGDEWVFINTTPPNSELVNNVLFFTDETFNGKSKTIAFDWSSSVYTEALNPKISFELEVFSLTKEYYDYQISYNYFLNNQGNPFADPVQVYSNIKGGFGVFAGYSLAAKVIRLK